MRAVSCTALLLIAGCGAKDSLLLRVTASPSIGLIDSLAISVVGNGMSSQPATHAYSPAIEIDAVPLLLNLQFPPGVKGMFTVTVTALHGTISEGMGTGMGTVADGVENVVDVSLCATMDHEWALWPMPNPVSTMLPNPANYDTSIMGIVKDLVTGLVWQQRGDCPQSWSNADEVYCPSLPLPGTGWRLPTRIELESLVDFTIAPSAATIDPVAFPGTQMNLYWTASGVAGDPTSAWGVQFADGTSSSAGVSGGFCARCVRSE